MSAAPAPTLRPWQSLKLRLAFTGALLIALAVALSAHLALATVSARSEHLALDLSLAQTRKFARLVSQRLVSMQVSLRNAATRLDASGLSADHARRFLDEQVVLDVDFDSMMVVDPAGHVLALRRRGAVTQPDLTIGDRAYFQQTLALKRAVVSEPLTGRAWLEPLVLLTMPVLDAHGDVTAVVSGSLRLATHRLLADVVEIDEDDPARTAVVDARGRIVAHPQPQWLMRDAAEEPALAEAIAQWVASGRPAEPSGTAARLGQRLVTWAGVAGTDWVVFRTAEESLVLGGVAQARERAMQVGAVVAAIGGAALLLITIALLAPLRRLEQVAATLADGAVPAADAWPRAQGEIGQLVTALRRAIEERAAADAGGRRLLAQLQAAMLHAPVGFAITRDKRFEMLSAHFERLLGYPEGELQGAPPRVIYARDDDYLALASKVVQCFGERRPFSDEIEFVRRDGSRFWGHLQGQPVHWEDGTAGTIWTLEDVTDERAARETLTWASTHDALTGLTNRAEFERVLSRHLADRRRPEGSALFIDLDRFKAVNDQAGHAAGDAMLVCVARTLERQVRSGDTVARLGGDEFAVLLDGCSHEDAARRAEKMRAAVQAIELVWDGAAFGVGASIGVVALDSTWPDAAAALAAADAACYAAKRGGRNSVHSHGSDSQPAALTLVAG